MLCQMIYFGIAWKQGGLSYGIGILLPLGLFAFLFFYLTFALLLQPLIVANRVEKDERLSSPVDFVVDEEQILFKNKFTETKLDWGSFQKVIESKSHFLLIYTVNKNMFQIIPKRAFASSEDEQSFRELLNTKIPRLQKFQFDLKNPVVLLAIVFTIGFCLFQCAVATFSFFLPALLSD